MSPPSATAPRRSPSAVRSGRRPRRRTATRRRHLVALVGTLVVALSVVLAMPLLRRAVNDLTLPLHYQDVIRQQAAEKHLDPALIAAVIYAESKFDPRTSSAGALGLMQILPQTAQFLAHRSGATSFTTADLATPSVNIAYGSYYLRYLLNEYRGSTVLALAAYNGGEANVSDWLAREHGRFTVSDIPFPETRAYVVRVMQFRLRYRHTYGAALEG